MDDSSQTPPAAPQSDIQYDQLHNQSLRDIAAETPPAEPTTEPVAPVPEQDEPTLDQVGKQIAEDTARRILEEQEARRQEEAAKAIPTEDEKVYLDWAEKFGKENGNPPTYLEAMEFVKEQAVKEIETRQEQKAKDAQDELNRQEEARRQTQEAGWKVINQELEDMYNHNLLTRIQDENNPSDQGRIERDALFNQMADENQRRAQAGQQQILSVTQFHNFYYKRPTAQPAGADAPISGNRGSSVPPSSEQQYTYQDLKRPWSFFKQVSK